MLTIVWLLLGLGAPALPQDAAEPIPAPDLVAWRSIQVGEAEARMTGRPVLYFFSADWCAPCAAMKRTVFSDPAVADLIERSFVPVEVDDVLDENQESTPEVEALKFRFLVSRIPSLVVSRPDGGPAVSEVGVPVHSKMVRFLESAGARHAELERSYEAHRNGSRSRSPKSRPN